MKSRTLLILLSGLLLLKTAPLTADDLSSGGSWVSFGSITSYGVVGGAYLSSEGAVGAQTNNAGIVYTLFISAGIPQGQDSDGDGMTDAWEFERGLDATVDDAALDPDRRAVFVLVFLEGLTCREAGELLDIPLGTVLSRIHRARGELRRLLRHLGSSSEAADAGDARSRGSA